MHFGFVFIRKSWYFTELTLTNDSDSMNESSNGQVDREIEKLVVIFSCVMIYASWCRRIRNGRYFVKKTLEISFAGAGLMNHDISSILAQVTGAND